MGFSAETLFLEFTVERNWDAEKAEMEGKNADWFLKYRDGVFKEIQLLERQKNQYDGCGGECGFTDEP